MKARLGYIVLFVGDKRKLNATIKNVTTFSDTSHSLRQGDTDVTSTYISDAETSAGNMLISATLGGNASIPAGPYRYYVTGTYSGKVRTWYWEILSLAKDLSQLPELPTEDYNPLVEEITIHEGDNFTRELNVPGADFSDATGVLKFDDSDKTADYCNSAASASGETLTTHNIGANASIPAGDYGYFLTGTYDNGETVATWFYLIHVLPKRSIV